MVALRDDTYENQSTIITPNQTVNTALFKALMHTADDSILNLPPLRETIVDYSPSLPAEYVFEYNEQVAKGNASKPLDKKRGGGSKLIPTRLKALLLTRQYLVSPIIAQNGASNIVASEELQQHAADNPGGTLLALREQVDLLFSTGHKRIVATSSDVSMLRVAQKFMRKHCRRSFIYHGSLDKRQRAETTRDFLSSDGCILFLAIDSGGTGLHLVPGCNAMIFFGCQPFTRSKTEQVMHRIHRIGQERPVDVIHLISSGSAEASIRSLADSKCELHAYLLDDDNESEFCENLETRLTMGKMLSECGQTWC